MYALIAVALVGLLRVTETTASRRLRWALCVLVLAAASYQLTWLGRDVVTGDGSSDRLLVAPRYPPLRVPSSGLATQFGATGRLGADFAQIYFPVRADLPIQSAYWGVRSVDPWERGSRFAPLVYVACDWTVCRLPYGWASLAHLGLQIALLGYGLARTRQLLALPRDELPTMLAVAAACVFLAPVGLAFLERGQWTVYVGLSYLWLLLGILLDRPRYVVAAAALAFLKWTSLPFAYAILGAHALSGSSIADCLRRMRPALLFAATFGALFLCLPEEGLTFLKGVQRQERGLFNGLTLLLFLPRPAVKLLPHALIAVGAMCLRGRRPTDPALVPFAAGAAVLLLGYPTVAHDYSVPTLLGFLPLVAYWARSVALPAPLGAGVKSAFTLFLVLASWSAEVLGPPSSVVAAYVVASTTLVALAFARVSGSSHARCGALGPAR